jgi:hypothetical protein
VNQAPVVIEEKMIRYNEKRTPVKRDVIWIKTRSRTKKM